MRCEVILPRSVQKELNAISQKDHDRIISRLESLEENPRPANVKKLKNRPAWRTRSSDYRVIYEINDTDEKVTIIKIAHRRNVYR